MIDSNNNLNKLSKSLLESAKGIIAPKQKPEGAEQIDELSRKTLSNYVRRAIPDKEQKLSDARQLSKIGHDMKQIDNNIKGGEQMHQRAGHLASRSANRHVGINRALDRLTKEEVEQVDELSDPTLRSYLIKTKTGDGRAVANMNDPSSVKKYTKRVVGRVRAANRLVTKTVNKDPSNPFPIKEDVEQIDELSRETMQSYRTKAKADPAFEKRKGKVSAARKAVQAKRTVGIERATKKIADINNREYKEHEAVNLATTNHMKNEGAHKILTKHGFKKAAENDRHALYTKIDKEGAHIHTVHVHKNDGRKSDRHISSFRSTTGWQSSDDRHYGDSFGFSGGVKKLKDLDHHKKQAEKSFSDHIKDQLDYHSKKALEESVQQIDELSKGTLARYAGRAMNDVRNANQAKIRWQQDPKKSYSGTHPKTGEHVTKSAKEMEDKHGRVAKNRETGVRRAIARMAKEEVEQIDESEYWDLHFKRQTPKVQNHLNNMMRRGKSYPEAVKACEPHGCTPIGHARIKEETELDEARGRPRKNPLPAAKAGQTDEPEARQHIMQQLQRAKLSMHGGDHITFKDGSKHFVKGDHAAKLLSKYAGMKPFEKEAFQKKIHGSHSDLKSEL